MTAIVYSGTLRYFRQKSRRVARSRWKGAIAWYCVLAIGGFFGLNWIYQVIRKPGEVKIVGSEPRSHPTAQAELCS